MIDFHSLSNEELFLRFEGIVNTAIDGIITIDSRGIIEYVNRSVCLLFGYEYAELIGQNINILMDDNHAKQHNSYIGNYLQTKTPKIIGLGREVLAKKKSGDIFPCKLAISQVQIDNKIIFTGIIHDLTEVDKANKELIDLNGKLESLVSQRTIELEEVINNLLLANEKHKQQEKKLISSLEKEMELNELKSRLVSMASHELRTPLSSMLSSADLSFKYIELSQFDKLKMHLSKIRAVIHNMTETLNDFSSANKEEEKLDIEQLEQIDIVELLNQVSSELDFLKIKKQKTVIRNSQPLLMKTIPRILKNLLYNLISNAIKYSHKNGAIEIHAKSENDTLKLSVKDNGIGIPIKDQKHVFSSFFRASNVSNIQGTGLGLHISNKYVNSLNGNLSFVSQPGEGTTFLLTLPLKYNEDINHRR